jgi:mRNA interferase RelE/StbE
MGYRIDFEENAAKAFDDLDKATQKEIARFLDRFELIENPRCFGKALRHNLYGLWRYRVGEYRLIANIQDDILLILIVDLGKRDDIYG